VTVQHSMCEVSLSTWSFKRVDAVLDRSGCALKVIYALWWAEALCGGRKHFPTVDQINGDKLNYVYFAELCIFSPRQIARRWLPITVLVLHVIATKIHPGCDSALHQALCDLSATFALMGTPVRACLVLRPMNFSHWCL